MSALALAVAVTGFAGTYFLPMAGLLNRGWPEVHKRLMLLATLLVLWPA